MSVAHCLPSLGRRFARRLVSLPCAWSLCTCAHCSYVALCLISHILFLLLSVVPYLIFVISLLMVYCSLLSMSFNAIMPCLVAYFVPCLAPYKSLSMCFVSLVHSSLACSLCAQPMLYCYALALCIVYCQHGYACLIIYSMMLIVACQHRTLGCEHVMIVMLCASMSSMYCMQFIQLYLLWR